MLLILKK